MQDIIIQNLSFGAMDVAQFPAMTQFKICQRFADDIFTLLLIATPIVGSCNCSMFCCALLCVHSSIAIISMGKRELVTLPCLSSWFLVIVVWLFLTMPRVCLQFVIEMFPDHTHLLFFLLNRTTYNSSDLAIQFSFQQVHITRLSIFISTFSSNFMKVQITPNVRVLSKHSNLKSCISV